MTQPHSQSRQIGDHTIEVHYLPPDEAMDLLVDLSRMLGPSLAALAESRGLSMEDLGDTDVSELHLSDAVERLVRNATKDDLRALTRQLRKVSFVDGKPLNDGNYQLLFQGKPALLMRWVAFAVEAQFADFFSEFAGVVGTFAARQRRAPEAPAE